MPSTDHKAGLPSGYGTLPDRGGAGCGERNGCRERGSSKRRQSRVDRSEAARALSERPFRRWRDRRLGRASTRRAGATRSRGLPSCSTLAAGIATPGAFGRSCSPAAASRATAAGSGCPCRPMAVRAAGASVRAGAVWRDAAAGCEANSVAMVVKVATRRRVRFPTDSGAKAGSGDSPGTFSPFRRCRAAKDIRWHAKSGA